MTPLSAGTFGHWARQMEVAIAGLADADVACDGCTACCTSSQFVFIGADETETLAHIPPELLFPAPRMQPGNVVMGYDDRGHCPMLIDDRCSIYEHRPRTCRTYDCRIFAAAGVEVVEPDKQRIGMQAKRWVFDDQPADDSNDDWSQHLATREAAEFIRKHADDLRDAIGQPTSTQIAVMAFRLRALFGPERDRPTVDVVRKALN